MIRYYIDYTDRTAAETGNPYQRVFGATKDGAIEVFEAYNPDKRVVHVEVVDIDPYAINNRYTRFGDILN